MAIAKKNYILLSWIAGLLCAFFMGNIAHALPVIDSTKPGETIEFWWTKDNNKVTGTKVRIKMGLSDWGDQLYTSNQNGGFYDYNESNSTIYYEFIPPDGTKVTDWHQSIKHTNGKSSVYDVNIKKGSPWVMYPLTELPDIFWRIPDLSPISGGNSDLTIYTAVNMDLYLLHNPLGFLNGNWSIGQSLDDLGVSIQNGVVLGVEGIYWSTSEFVFDPDPNGFGFMPSGGMSDMLDSSTFREDIGIIAEHTTTPEPSTWLLLASGFTGLIGYARRQRKLAG